MNDDALRRALKRWPDALAYLCDQPTRAGPEWDGIEKATHALLDALQATLRPGGVPDCFEPDVKALQSCAPTKTITG